MIKGHSPCSIVFKDNIVIKKSNDIKNSNRLKIQKQKQEYFLSKIYKGIEVPEIYSEGYDNDLYYFKMKYYNKHNFVNFFEISNKKDLDYFINIIIDFICENLKKSKYKKIDKGLIFNKFLDVQKNISENKLCKISNYFIDDKILKKCIDNVDMIPYGIDHGDLTLSNMLFDIYDKKIILIDFLNSFIDTPYNDIIKIKQDTNIKWSLNLVDFKYDFVKVNIVLDYIDDIINKKINIDDNLYLLLQYMNLLRVMQYVKDVKIFHFLKKEIKRHEELINSSCG